MMKKLFSVLLVVVFATSVMAQMGLTCNDPIPVDESYTGTVSGPCELWYVANTYDLPLHVYFSPFADQSRVSPDVSIDFTCTPGVYEDPKIDSLINLITDFDIEFPVEFMCDLVVRDGRNEWDLSIDKSYRERMAEFGITYNVKALVKVTYHEGGTISLKPDDLFKDCMEKADVIRLGDTLNILPNDEDRVFAVSYSDWQNDSIRFVWIGEESTRVWLGETMCDFEPSLADPFVWNYFDVTKDQPYKLYTEQMKEDIKEHSGGLFYGKIVAPVAGKLVVEKIPKSKPLGDAELLEYGKGVTLAANNTDKLYCFPKEWTATEFVAPTAYNITMYLSNQPNFEAVEKGENVLAAYSFDTEDTNKILHLSTKEIATIKAQAKDNYIYVRFQTAVATTVTPNPWESLACLEYSVQINPNVAQSLPANNKNAIYRFRYADFKDYNLTIQWGGNGILSVYMADTCVYELTNRDPRVLLYTNISRRGSYTINAATLDEWATRIGQEGYLYVRFNNTISSRVTFKTDKPAEVDPEIPVIPTSPCVLGSIELKAGDQLTLNLDSAFTIYRVNYAEFAAQDRTLTWTGATDLHTFVAETCTFAVAPYNKHVHVYVPVPAQGETLWTVAQWADLATFVDEDGYLYLRFLTEKEGVLTVE